MSRVAQGWPFGTQALAPYYAESLRSLDLELTEDNETLWDWLGLREPGFDPAELRTHFFQFDEQFERITLRRCHDPVESAKVRILLRATVLDIRGNAEGSAVESLEIGICGGGRGIVRARVRAGGGGGSKRRDQAVGGVCELHFVASPAPLSGPGRGTITRDSCVVTGSGLESRLDGSRGLDTFRPVPTVQLGPGRPARRERGRSDPRDHRKRESEHVSS